MPQPPQQIVFQEYIHAIDDAGIRLERLTQAVENALPGWKWEPVVRALMSLRGMHTSPNLSLDNRTGHDE